MKTYQMFLNGQFCTKGVLRDIVQPYNGKPFAKVYFGNEEILKEAINGAGIAFKTMKSTPSHVISDILRRVSQKLKERSEEFAKTLALEAGKPIKTARGEVGRAIHTFMLGAEEGLRIAGEVIPMDQKPYGEGRFGTIKRFPLGVIGAITPFNFPLNLVAHKLAPAFAAKNTVILKPASQTPISALLLAELFMEAGLPEGALHVIPAKGSAGEVLARDPRVKMLTFTGSPTIGWRLKEFAFRKKVTLELGGNAGVIVHSDVDIDTAIVSIANAGFLYAGQSCISVQRVFIHQSIYNKVVEGLVKMAESFKLGDPVDESTDIGSMISEDEAKRIESWVAEAASDRARVLTGGTREGSVYHPTIIENTKAEMKVNCLEVFAPVITVTPYEDFEKAVKAVDNSKYGLQAGVFTKDIDRIRYAFENIEVGGVIIGDVPTYRIDHMPYGGVKESGNAREGVRYAIEEMTEPRLMVLKFAQMYDHRK
ncbi:MAG: aldehyde dehydrogenase family protein [Candidatus Marinimicrobia bacterium]|nr:aldehyde dehydrogenase family protein [Candidatus Neomarinimicrobiota bacterium]